MQRTQHSYNVPRGGRGYSSANGLMAAILMLIVFFGPALVEWVLRALGM